MVDSSLSRGFMKLVLLKISLVTIGLSLDLLGLPTLMIVFGTLSLILVAYAVIALIMNNNKEKKLNGINL